MKLKPFDGVKMDKTKSPDYKVGNKKLSKKLKNIKMFEEFSMNESEAPGTDNLKKQGATLGKELTSSDELKKNKFYCIVDMGMLDWNGGYEYKGVVDGKHMFKDMLSPGNKPYGENPMTFTDSELEDYITDGYIANDNS
jgi:hypothetical protein